MRVLVAESRLDDAQNLAECLTALGLEVCVATSREGAMTLLRSTIFSAAVVAVEFGLEERSLISRLSRLPSIQAVWATGPAGDWERETQARRGGARGYFPRPVSVKSLAMAVCRSAWPPVCRGPPKRGGRAQPPLELERSSRQ